MIVVNVIVREKIGQHQLITLGANQDQKFAPTVAIHVWQVLITHQSLGHVQIVPYAQRESIARLDQIDVLAAQPVHFYQMKVSVANRMIIY